MWIPRMELRSLSLDQLFDQQNRLSSPKYIFFSDIYLHQYQTKKFFNPVKPLTWKSWWVWGKSSHVVQRGWGGSATTDSLGFVFICSYVKHTEIITARLYYIRLHLSTSLRFFLCVLFISSGGAGWALWLWNSSPRRGSSRRPDSQALPLVFKATPSPAFTLLSSEAYLWQFPERGTLS